MLVYVDVVVMLMHAQGLAVGGTGIGHGVDADAPRGTAAGSTPAFVSGVMGTRGTGVVMDVHRVMDAARPQKVLKAKTFAKPRHEPDNSLGFMVQGRRDTGDGDVV